MKPAFPACLALMLAQPAAGGAWLEQKGKGFSSATATYRFSGSEGSIEVGYYGAYGISPRLTAGIDLNRSGRSARHALLFARLPLSDGSRYRLAAEAAFGVSRAQEDWLGMQRFTVSYGRGLGSDGSKGWLAIDAAYELRNAGAIRAWKLDSTLGLHRGSGPAPIFQVETYKARDSRLIYSVSPGMRFPLPGSKDLLLSLEYRKADRRSLGLELGIWQKF